MLKTAFHKLTHVSEHSTKEYVELRESVAKIIGEEAWTQEVAKQLDVFKRTNPDKYNSMTKEERIEYASKEALAEACTALVEESDLLMKMAKDNPSIGEKIINKIKEVISKIRKMLKLEDTMDVEIARALKVNATNLQEIVDKWDTAVMEGLKNQNAKQAVKETSEQKNNTATNDDVQYLARDNNSSIKEQLKDKLNVLSEMNSVVSVNSDYEFNGLQEAKEWAVEQLKDIGDIVKRNNFGDIIIDKKRIKNGFRYLKTKEEIIAFITVPDVLKKGIKIDEHRSHKSRNYDTVTFAAPVEINSQVGYVAVVVRMDENNYYKVHRILSSDGSQFIFTTKKDIAERAGGVKNDSGLSPADNVSINIISNPKENVNDNSTQFSMRYTPATVPLEKRLTGDDLLNAQDTVEEIKSVNGFVDEFGNATLYHGTNDEAYRLIKKNGIMKANEDGLFFSTKEDGIIKDYGNKVIRVKIPVENLVLDDVFEDELHYRVPLTTSDYSADVSKIQYDIGRGNLITNRMLLADALESTAQNSTELANLRAYKEGLQKLDEDTERLNNINKQIKEISFTKGADRSQLLKLNNQKKFLENKIHRKDKALLELESMETIRRIIDVEKKRTRKLMDNKRKKVVNKIRDSRTKADYIERIKRLQRKMVSMVKHPTDSMYVPQYMANDFNNACILIVDALNHDNGTKGTLDSDQAHTYSKPKE